MAQRKKTVSPGKGTSVKNPHKGRPSAKKAGKDAKGKAAQRNERAYTDPSLKVEVISIIVIAAAVLLAVFLFSKKGIGSGGEFISSFLVGLFGIGAYILPFAIIITCLAIIFADGIRVLRSHIIMLGSFFFAMISSLHILTADLELKFESIGSYVGYYYKGASASNGGLAGAMFGNLLYGILGKAGALIVLITAATVLLILVTGRSLFALLEKIRRKAETAVKHQRRKLNQRKLLSAEKDPRRDFDESFGGGSQGGLKRFFNHRIEPEEYEDDEEERQLDIMNARFVQNGSFSKIRPKHDPEPKPPLSDDDLSEDGIKVFKTYSEKKETERLGEKYIPDEDTDEPPFDCDDAPKEPEASLSKAAEEEAAAALAEVRDDFKIKIKGIGIEGAEPGDDDDDDDDFGMPRLEDEFEETVRPLEEYVYPPLNLLNENDYTPSVSTMVQIKENSKKLEDTLRSFGVEARVIAVSKGPTVTRYELSPGVGVKVNKISGLADDLALSLAAMSIRIEAPIPGKSAVGIELPNKETQPVFVREVIDSPEFNNSASRLTFAVGKDIAGNIVVSDIAKMPHLLIAGSTGSGKSVCINTLITSILYKARPDEVKLLMIDPKVVELSVYNGIPHLLIPVVTDPKKAAGALNWAVIEMERRYALLASVNVRDLKGYNAAAHGLGQTPLPQIVIIIDELADLMMSSGKEVEEYICRIAQKARAAGIHLIIATQRPSVNVITGTIKANVGSRLAFAVTSGIDSRTILDQIGAERLLGKGDMLFSPMGLSKPQRIQGAFISDKEVEQLVEFLKSEYDHVYDPAMVDEITAPAAKEKSEQESEMSDQFIDAVELILEKEKASTSMLQRYFRIGYNSAARLMEELENRGIVGPEDGVKPRKILVTRTEWEMHILPRK